jgi:hypothetical protein
MVMRFMNGTKMNKVIVKYYNIRSIKEYPLESLTIILNSGAITMEDNSISFPEHECLLMGLFLIEENGEFYE